MALGTKQARGSYVIGVNHSLIGMRVVNNEREDLGRIEDVLLDTRNNRASYAILSFGGVLGVGDKHFALPWEALVFDLSQRLAIIDVEKERLKNAPGFDKDAWPDVADAAWGERVYTYYGYTPYWQEEATIPTPKK
jgi:sporulation protein YlmC with PRC-barrel domain